ncbi:MAG: glycerol-3-phosphate 1-O-acyltransferase PlsY [Sedimentisphaerales bacterium]|jgi:glycerol-3-phosphate acyltransferase PlsY|nr:glycerol-3-phosphate 1-O-acyltransferase PlsY [Sedimentisphaerales bacterium]
MRGILADWILFVIAAYLLGSVPFAYILAKAHGIDLRTIGSGNIGATNLSRVLGRRWGYVCFFLDMLKGLVPMFAARALLVSSWQGHGMPQGQILAMWLVVGAAAVVGHVLPIYLGFRGGKGVATSFGVALGLWPYYTICAIITLCIWVAVLLLWRYVSVASIVAAVSFPVILLAAIAILPGWEFRGLWPIEAVAAVIAAVIVILHRANIRRLMSGTEHRIGAK